MSIPFLVIDRPNLLIPAREIDRQQQVGIMTHACTSKNFRSQIKNLDLVKICDSGVFLKASNQHNLTYKELFNRYEEMNANYGIIFDVLGDATATIESAKEAIAIYRTRSRSFKLIGVAQGKTIAEYVTCTQKLIGLGYKHIAIGGLLKKNNSSARYVRVKDEEFLEQVLVAVRKEWCRWLFCLGCYHPKRQELFDKYQIFGSDSKRWAFQCDGGLTTEDRHQQLIKNFLKDLVKFERNQKDRLTEDSNPPLNVDRQIESSSHASEISLEDAISASSGGFKPKKVEGERTAKPFAFQGESLGKSQSLQVTVGQEPKVCLIACCKTKAETKSPAFQLYKSSLFIKSYNYAQSLDCPIYILSAKYGLIADTEAIEPYDLVLDDFVKSDRERWYRNIAEQIKTHLSNTFLIVLAGETYLGFTDSIDNQIFNPLKGLKIGQRLSWLNGQMKDLLPDNNSKLNKKTIYSTIVEKNDDKINLIEKQIETYLSREQNNFYYLGLLLREIDRKELYSSFEYKGLLDYCNQRWKLSKSRVYQFLDAIAVAENLTSKKLTLTNFSEIISKLDYALPTTESQSRELTKLKNPELQKRVWQTAIAQKANPTAKIIKAVVSELKAKSYRPNLKRKIELNAVVRIVGNNPEIKQLQGCWGLISRVGENSYDVRTCLGDAIAIHPQYLMELQECDSAMAEKLIQRVKAIASNDKINLTVANLLREVATQPTVYLNEWQEYLLEKIEAKLKERALNLIVGDTSDRNLSSFLEK